MTTAPWLRPPTPSGNCIAPVPPAKWTTALQAHTVQLGSGPAFDVMAVSKGFAIGQLETRPFQLQMVNLVSSARTTISTFSPTAAGTGWIGADLPWVVWLQSESPYNGQDWSVHAWNQTTGVERVLATSRLSDGSLTRGQMPFPVVHNGVAYWAQPRSSTQQRPQADLQMVDLATGKTSILDSGSISSPVLAGSSMLIWGRSDGASAYTFRAVDLVTLQPVALPDQLTRYDSTIGYIAGSLNYLVWNGAGTVNEDLSFWKVGTSNFYHATLDSNHPIQFIQVAGHFLLWYTGMTSVVFDLEGGSGFDTKGGLAGSPETIVQTNSSQLSWIATRSAPSLNLSGCHT